MAEAPPQIAKIVLLTTIHVFRNATGEHNTVNASPVEDRIGEIEVFEVLRDRARHQRIYQRRRHAVGDRIKIFRRHFVTEGPVETGAGRVRAAGGIKPDNHTVLVNDLKTPADMNRCRHLDLTLFEDRQFCRPATDIDIQNAFVAILRRGGSTGAERRQHAFHVMAGRRTDKIAALLRHGRRNRLRILPAQGLAGQDHGTGINIVGAETCRFIGIVQNFSQFNI